MTLDEAWKGRIDNLISGVDEKIAILEEQNERLRAVVSTSHYTIMAGSVYRRELEDEIARLKSVIEMLKAGGPPP